MSYLTEKQGQQLADAIARLEEIIVEQSGIGGEIESKRLEAVHDALLGTLTKPGGLIHKVESLEAAFIKFKDAHEIKLGEIERTVSEMQTEKAKEKAFSRGKKVGLIAGAGGFGAALVKGWELLFGK